MNRKINFTSLEAKEELEKFRRCNAQAKERRAELRGFETAGQYKAYLEDIISSTGNVTESLKKSHPTTYISDHSNLHNVFKTLFV